MKNLNKVSCGKEKGLNYQGRKGCRIGTLEFGLAPETMSWMKCLVDSPRERLISRGLTSPFSLVCQDHRTLADATSKLERGGD